MEFTWEWRKDLAEKMKMNIIIAREGPALRVVGWGGGYFRKGSLTKLLRKGSVCMNIPVFLARVQTKEKASTTWRKKEVAWWSLASGLWGSRTLNAREAAHLYKHHRLCLWSLNCIKRTSHMTTRRIKWMSTFHDPCTIGHLGLREYSVNVSSCHLWNSSLGRGESRLS